MAYLLTLILCTAPMQCGVTTTLYPTEEICNSALFAAGESLISIPIPAIRVWAACTPHKPT